MFLCKYRRVIDRNAKFAYLWQNYELFMKIIK